MVAFAERAGVSSTRLVKWPANGRSPPATPLTAQEAQIARMARDGLSNPKIEFGIESRSRLDRVLPD